MKNNNRSILKFLFFPFSILYWLVTTIRNLFFDWGWLSSSSFKVPVIVVGNLSVGGTGKSPMTEYLIRLLKEDYEIAVLSRGYKRASEGFVMADENATVLDLGDEPFQFYRKFPNITLAVDADRTHGIQQILKSKPNTQVILLDDAYQHRKVKGSFYALLTSYENRYTRDFILPVGTLREARRGAKRAKAIVVTKCPDNLSEDEQQKICNEIAPTKEQDVFFTSIAYNRLIFSKDNQLELGKLLDYQIILVTGIANSKPLTDYLTAIKIDFKHVEFADHYNFKDKDISNIKSEFGAVQKPNKLILTTEKDFMRLEGKLEPLYYLGIETRFLNNQNRFDSLIKNQVNNI